MLTIGALIGALMGKAFLAMGIPAEYYNAFIIITMSAFLGAVLRTPITAVVLLIEITGSLSGVLTIGVEVLIAFIVAELLMRKPFYDVLLERMVENENTIPEFNFKKNK
jgi:H+/Cl- antiporter ClcA